MTAHRKFALIQVNGARIEFLGARLPKRLFAFECAN